MAHSTTINGTHTKASVTSARSLLTNSVVITDNLSIGETSKFPGVDFRVLGELVIVQKGTNEELT